MTDSLRDFFSVNILSMRISGTWRLISATSPTRAETFYSRAVIFTCLFFFLSMDFWQLRYTYKNFEKLIENLYVLLPQLVGAIKSLAIFLNGARILRIMDVLTSDDFHFDSEKVSYSKLIETNKRKNELVCKFLFAMGMGISATKPFSAFLAWKDRTDEDFKIGNVTCEEILPYCSFVPFSTGTTFSCGAGIFLQSVCTHFIIMIVFSLDSFFASLLFCVETHLQIIGKGFSTIRERCLEKLDSSSSSEIHDEHNWKLDAEMNREMRKSTRSVQTLIRICQELEDIYTYVMLCQVFSSIIMMASVLYIMSRKIVYRGLLVSLMTYFLGLTSQLGAYCWFGNEVTLASEILLNSLYDCEWLSASNSFKKSLLINMCRLQRPIHFTIGKFSKLSFVSFVSVIRTSYSYFTLLQNFSE